MNPETTNAALRDVIDAELADSASFAEVLERLDDRDPQLDRIVALLKTKEEEYRRSFYVRSEHIWYRRLGWRIMRPLFIGAGLGALLFTFQRKVDPTLGIALFLAGMATFYVLLQIFFTRWAHQDLKRLEEYLGEYREKLQELRRGAG